MSWNFTLDNYDTVWALVIQILLILGFLFIGDILRRVIPFLRKAFIPSALIGGLLLLVTNIVIKVCTRQVVEGVVVKEGFELVDKTIMQVITYHALAIGFIAMTLKVNKEKKQGLGVKSIQNGLITGGTYMLQAIFGIVTILIFVWAGNKIFYDAGVILPLSFGQGPGNALTWDINFSDPVYMEGLGVTENILNTNGSFGLSLASIGFIVSAVVGVIYINIFKRKGEIKVGEEAAEMARNVEEFVSKDEIEDSDSVDKLSIQVALVAVCYAATLGIMAALSFSNFTKNLAFGFNFIFGVIFATLTKLVLKFFKKHKIVKKEFINNYQMDRISGFSFDLMIIAGVAAIEINDIKDYIFPIIALSVVGTIITIVYVRRMSKLCFKETQHHMFLVNFGTLTGTASNGMILLREVDPTYKTDASNIFVISQLPAMITVAPLLLLLAFSAKSITNTYIAIGIFAVLFIGYTVANIIIAKKTAKKSK